MALDTPSSPPRISSSSLGEIEDTYSHDYIHLVAGSEDGFEMDDSDSDTEGEWATPENPVTYICHPADSRAEEGEEDAKEIPQETPQRHHPNGARVIVAQVTLFLKASNYCARGCSECPW
eukprot:CAMPEP_0114316628 /NCGR_PEP_ID=MMETSP0059-20121206/23346_1 /TAXON_ID=36894 /ORGANISM="Pyramimonas parkeae, Strain CCMP726" /LENGTH=119 /DNA_ID=CAMNT_0001442655 /DNA_START=128 /DNA_END=487 /DNA_ORIENTATION=+